jgi:hypothetical protein
VGWECLEDVPGDVVEAGFRFGCGRLSRTVGWLVGDRFVAARCKAPNKCPFCAYLAACENAVVVSLDSEAQGPPRVGMTLTTVDPEYRPDVFRRGVEQTFRAIRRRYPAAEYLGFMEWTTGEGPRSGGLRRAHVHVLLRGVAPGQVSAVEAVVRKVWAGERAMGSRLEVRELRTPAGATAYLTLHHHKQAQRPPAGLAVKRFRPSRGYFSRPVAEWRAEARELLSERRVRRAAWSVLDWETLDRLPEDVVQHEFAAAIVQARLATAQPTLVRMDVEGRIVFEECCAG